MSVKIDLMNTRKLIEQIEALKKQFTEEVRTVVLQTAVEVHAHIIENDIPIDTGRLRASFHIKFLKKPDTTRAKALRLPAQQTTYTYSAKKKNKNRTGQESFDGTISEPVTDEFVIVGSNVEYAKRINRLGGGGEYSRRKDESGSKRPKGYGQGFFDKAVERGYTRFLQRSRNLVARIERLTRKGGSTGGGE